MPPKDLLSRLTAHSQRSNQFNETLADYFRARSAAEADYAAALNKISRKFADAGLGRDTGGEGGVWDRAMSELVEVSRNLPDSIGCSSACWGLMGPLRRTDRLGADRSS